MAELPPDRTMEEATIMVPSRGGGPPEESKEPQFPPGPNPELMDDKKYAGMSEEDRALKERLDLAVERLKDPSNELRIAALELLRKEIRESTSSMTSVPKPLKFLAEHYDGLRSLYRGSANANATFKRSFADVMSVLAMTMGKEPRESLHFKLEGDASDIGSWGHEYVRHLSGEIASEYNARREKDDSADVQDLLNLIKLVVPFDMAHNAEAEAVDLLLETSQLSLLLQPGIVDESNHGRVCLYLIKCGDYLGDEEEVNAATNVAFQIFVQQKQFPDALRLALKIGGTNEDERIRELFSACGDAGVRKQMAYVLGRHRSSFVSNDGELDALIGNNTLSALFAELARDLDVVEAKTPEDIFKSHLAGGTGRGNDLPQPESARANLASTFVNAFVNAGFHQDKLVTTTSTWVYKNRDHGMLSAAASVGMIHLWNPDEGLNAVSKYLDVTEEHIRAGALLGVGIACAGTRNLDVDPALAVFSDHVTEGSKSTNIMKLAALQGLGLAYAGSKRAEIAELLMPYIQDESASKSIELAAMAGVSLGLIFVGTGNDEYTTVILDRLMSLDDGEATQAITRHLALGLGLLLLGRGDEADPTLEVLATIEKPIGQQTNLLVQACAYAGTGNVLQVQKLLRVCATHPEAEDREKEEKEKAARTGADATAAGPAGAATGAPAAGGSTGAAGSLLPGMPAGSGAATAGAGAADSGSKGKDVAGKYIHQSVAVLGLALVSMGEELSVDMASRMADHLLQYGDTAVRRTVPLALALCHISDPDYAVVDLLSKLTHDQNDETAQTAIFSLGLIGAGTNNSRIAGLLRTLSTFYKSEADHLFVVRIAQGLLHMGKGLITISPFHSGRLLLAPTVLGGILTASLCAMDFKSTLHKKWHFLLYNFAIAMNPRFMTTVSEAGEHVPVEVRVGQAVETVGQAGRPKTITGFQTHTTPVLLGVKDRAELVDDAYLPLTNVVEWVVVLRPNPAATKKQRKAATGGSTGAAGGAKQ